VSRRPPLSRRSRWIGGGVAFVAFAALAVYVVVLPMRQTRFQVVEHRLVGSGNSAIEGRILNRGPEARNVLVEAYLYDADGRYIRTARTSLPEVPGEQEVEFRLPLDPAISGRVGRYSMYTGLEPNPYAPDAL